MMRRQGGCAITHTLIAACAGATGASGHGAGTESILLAPHLHARCVCELVQVLHVHAGLVHVLADLQAVRGGTSGANEEMNRSETRGRRGGPLC